MQQLRIAGLAVLVALVLTACGGGDGGGDVAVDVDPFVFVSEIAHGSAPSVIAVGYEWGGRDGGGEERDGLGDLHGWQVSLGGLGSRESWDWRLGRLLLCEGSSRMRSWARLEDVVAWLT